MVDGLVKPTLTWKNIGIGTAFISNRGNAGGNTGGSTLPIPQPGTGTPGTGGTGTSGTTTPQQPPVSVIIPFAATPMR